MLSLLSIDTLFSPELTKILFGDKMPFGVGFPKKRGLTKKQLKTNTKGHFVPK